MPASNIEEAKKKWITVLLLLGIDFYVAALKLKKNITRANQLFSWAEENLKENNRFAPYWRKWEAQLNELRTIESVSESDIIKNLEDFKTNLDYRSYLSMAYILFWQITQIN
jgi:hypothetical protein